MVEEEETPASRMVNYLHGVILPQFLPHLESKSPYTHTHWQRIIVGCGCLTKQWWWDSGKPCLKFMWSYITARKTITGTSCNGIMFYSNFMWPYITTRKTITGTSCNGIIIDVLKFIWPYVYHYCTCKTITGMSCNRIMSDVYLTIYHYSLHAKPSQGRLVKESCMKFMWPYITTRKTITGTSCNGIMFEDYVTIYFTTCKTITGTSCNGIML